MQDTNGEGLKKVLDQPNIVNEIQGNYNKALRHNSGKLDWTLLDFDCLIPMVEGMTYGATKYTRNNWKLQCDDPKQHLQSAMRHLIAIIQGEEIDEESGVRHSGLIQCNMMMYNYHSKDITNEK